MEPKLSSDVFVYVLVGKPTVCVCVCVAVSVNASSINQTEVQTQNQLTFRQLFVCFRCFSLLTSYAHSRFCRFFFFSPHLLPHRLGVQISLLAISHPWIKMKRNPFFFPHSNTQLDFVYSSWLNSPSPPLKLSK